MSSCVFNVNGADIIIQCKEEETMENICKSLASKTGIDINKNLFLYNGLQINMNLPFEKQINEFDKERKQMNIVVFEQFQNQNENPKEIMRQDLMQNGFLILKKHLDGRSYKEEKTYDWINTIINDFESYFYQKYPSYYIFSFCFICPKTTFYLTDNKSIVSKEEAGSKAVFSSDDIQSALSFFFFKNFTSISCPYLEPRLIKYGNKLLYEIFDERKFAMILQECCIRLNKEVGSNILKIFTLKRFLIITYAFKKPATDFSYNFKTKPPFNLSKIIQTFVTDDIEVWHFLFIVSNDK
jgi:hypothetical protein